MQPRGLLELKQCAGGSAAYFNPKIVESSQMLRNASSPQNLTNSATARARGRFSRF